MFGKYFASTFTGSMLGAGSHVFAVWGYAIANAVGGQVELNPQHIAHLIGMTPEDVEHATAFLCAPDPRSRSQVADGRRMIQEGTFAYRLTNWEVYRRVRSEDDRRAYNRQKQAEHRAKKPGSVKTRVNDSQSQSPMSAQAEAEAEAEAETPKDQVVVGTAAAVRGRLPVSSHGAFDGLLKAAQNPLALAAEVGALLDGMHGPQATPEAMGQALRDLVLGGGRVTGVGLRSFVARAMRERQESTPGDGWDDALRRAEVEDRAAGRTPQLGTPRATG